jgi:hypothetical protein
MDATTEKVVRRLEKLGFKINSECADGEVYMSRKRRGVTFYATVEINGNVNTEPADQYIEWVKNYNKE